MGEIVELKRRDAFFLSLSDRTNKNRLEDILVNLDSPIPEYEGDYEQIEKTASAIIKARESGSSIIITYGAHTIKNGLQPVLIWMIENGFVTHLATNGAGSIHDWEYAYQGESEEDVRHYVKRGQFGLWDETGKYINLAVTVGAAEGKGYGQSVCKLIQSEELVIPDTDEIDSEIAEINKKVDNGKATDREARRSVGLQNLRTVIKKYEITPGRKRIEHKFRNYSVQEVAYKTTKYSDTGVLFTVHPGLGCDIIHNHPLCSFAGIGLGAETDYLRFAQSVCNLEGGVYLCIGSAVMAPMVFEKSLSIARNIAVQKHTDEEPKIADFLLGVVDIQPPGDWIFGTGEDPPKTSPAYYLRFAKTFDRMGAKEMYYAQVDNRNFMLNLYHCLKLRVSH